MTETSKPLRRSSSRVVLSSLLLLLSAARPSLAASGIGLSAMRAQALVQQSDLPGFPSELDRFARVAASGDWNHDGVEDLAIGVPGHDGVYGGNPIVWAGAVIVYDGVRGQGLATGASAERVLSQFEAGDHPPQYADRFGSALATGDFNGDGIDDLAVGIPNDRYTFQGVEHPSGAVEIFFGGPLGLATLADQHIHWFNIAGDGFGSALAAGDFDGDGDDDLAVGIPTNHGYFVGGDWQPTGAIWVIPGGPSGLTPATASYFDQGTLPFSDFEEPEPLDLFGFALASADLNGDGYDDLVIGVPGEDGSTGLVHALRGSATGLDRFSGFIWWQSTLFADPAEPGDAFGFSLASGDFDGDGFRDVAIGSPWEDDLFAVDAGLVGVAYGDHHFFVNPIRFLVHRPSDYFDYEPGVREIRAFGSALAAGNFDADRRMIDGVSSPVDDLAVGAERTLLLGQPLGAVAVLMGNPEATLAVRFESPHPGIDGIPLTSQFLQGLGAALATGDWNGDGYADLLLGLPERDIAEVLDLGTSGTDQGAAVALYGSLFSDGFESGNDNYWFQFTH